ncbi:hypothetical protein [Haloplanus halobius]|nr:hypothetical protein [Haloplanus sp. XH21]
MAESNAIPRWWILLFLLLALGLGAFAVSAIGGSLIASVVLPV